MLLSRALVLVVTALAFGSVHATPIAYEGSLTSGATVSGDVPLNSYIDASAWDYWSFFGTGGDVVSITLDRTSDQMDPGVGLLEGLGGDSAGLTAFEASNPTDGLLTWLTSDDDGGSDTPPGPFSNSLISGFVLPTTGYYTVVAYDVLGASTGPWTYGLTGRGFTGSAAVPEPATLTILGLGLAGLGFSRRKKS